MNLAAWWLAASLALVVQEGAAQDGVEDPARRLARADQLLRAGQAEPALALLDELAGAPGVATADVLRLRAAALFELGREGDARDALVEALRAGAFGADVIARLFEIDRDAPGVSPSTEIGELALLHLLEPTRRQWLALLAESLARHGMSAVAIRTWQQALAREPEWAEGWLALGSLHLQEAEGDAARAALETGFHLGARAPQLERTIAELWHRAGAVEQARLWYERAEVSGETEDVELVLRELQLDLELKDHAMLRERAARLLERPDPDSAARARVHALLARAHLAAGDDEAAAREAIEAASLGHPDRALLRAIGLRESAAGRPANAALLLAASLDPTSPDLEGQHALVWSLLRSDQGDAARTALRRSLEFFGLDEETGRMLDALAAAGS